MPEEETALASADTATTVAGAPVLSVGLEVSPAEAAIEHARGAHANFQAMVQLADQKAATLMGAAGVIVALLGSNLVDKFVQNKVTGLLPWSGAGTLLLLLGAALCSILVLVPRFPGQEQLAPVVGAPGLMWGISKYFPDPGAYVRAALAVSSREVIADLTYESLKINWILGKKWKWLKRATWLLGAAFIAWAGTVVLAVLGG